MRPKSKILVIAGSDSSGGAGIQADIKTITSLGGYAMTAITAITSQNTTGVYSVFSVNPREIEKQISFTCKDIKPDVIKIGMLQSSKVIETVVKSLSKIKTKKIKNQSSFVDENKQIINFFFYENNDNLKKQCKNNKI